MKTKPLNEIIDECIEYSSTPISINYQLECKFFYYRDSYNSSYDLLKYDLLKQSSHNYKERIIFIELFERYMNVNRFKA